MIDVFGWMRGRSLSSGLTAAVLALAMGLLAVPASAQTGTVEGQVTTATGRAIGNAQVALEGTGIGTVTGADGRFVLLNVPVGAQQLRVSAIGYTVGTLQFTVRAGAITTADVSLNRSVLRLDEVVVTGTAGAARRREVGNSISQINAADIADPPANVDQLLQARSPGVNVMQGSGMAGSGAQIRLRGFVSVAQTNQPLIYIDGVRTKNSGFRKNVPPVGYSGRSGNVAVSPLNDINPADIERIEVIKGAAAATIYGTDASAGVIQIFTKRGREGRPRFNLQMDQGFAHEQKFGTDENPFMNLKPCTEGTSCWDGWTQSNTVGNCADINPDPHCSWLRNAYRQKYTGSVAGGTSDFGYFVSGAWSDYDGVLPNDQDQRLVGRANFNFSIRDNLRVDINTMYSNNDIANTAAGNNAHGVTLNVFRAERNYFQSSEPSDLQLLLNQDIDTEIDRIITGATVNYTPFPWFTNRFTLGYDQANQENRNLRPFGFVRAPTGILSDEQVKFTTLTADYVGNIDFSLTDNIQSTFSFGGQTVTSETFATTAYGDTFPGPGVPTVSNASTFISREERIRIVTAGFFFQNVLNFSDKYFLTGGARIDGNSSFGGDFPLEVYPKVQGSYVISDENFWPEGLGAMKLRAALGLAGRAPGAFDAVRTWSPIAFDFTPAFTPDNVGNPDVGPERTREIEFGADWALFDGRVSTEFTWYHQKTTDALFNVRQIPSNGFTGSQAANVGELRNAGIELGVNAIVIDAPDFGLDLGANIYTSHSKVLDLGDAVPFNQAGGGWVETGFPVMAARGIQYLDPNAFADGEFCATDGSNASTCNLVRDHIFGPQQPTEVIGLNARVRLPEGITLSARGEYQGGAYIRDGASNNALRRSVRWPLCSRAHGILDADPAAVDQLTTRERMECIPSNVESDLFWFKQDFFKMRDITLTVPLQRLIPRTSSATLSLTAQNAIRWINDDLRIFDPEMTDNNGPSGRTSSGIDDQNRSITEHIPSPAIFTASIRVVF